MSITITITDPSPELLRKLVATLNDVDQTPADKAEKPKAEKPKAEPKAEKPKDEPKAEVEEADAAEEASEVPSKEDVTAAAQALVAANGREALAELLGKFNAKNLSSVAEGDREKFIAKCEEATK